MKKPLFALLCLALASIAAAAPENDGEGEKTMTAEEFEAQLKYQRGRIELRNGLATLEVPDGFRYLDPDQAERVLVQAWGNPPPEEKPLGMLFPADLSPLADGGWGVVITYQEDGYIKDDDADTLDYNELLKEMQEGARENNKARQEAGFEPVNLVGWAEPPHYDKGSHKLYWAKELQFGNEPEHTLNYNIRVLGRRGVLVLNAVSSMRQLEDIKHDMQQVLTFVEYNEGHRYIDFDASADKVAEYGLGALVAGTVAAKTGVLKGLVALLVAGKKVVIIGLAGVAAAVKKFFGGGNNSDTRQA